MKKNYKKLQNFDRIGKELKQKYQKKYSKNMEITECKNHKKYFNLSKFQQIEKIFIEETEILEKSLEEF